MDTLFISNSFFGYAREIKAELERRGRNVLWCEDRPAQDTTSKIAIRLSPRILKARSDKFFADITEQAASHSIKDVLVIKGEALSLDAIALMRARLPQARFTIYFWDSYRNMPSDSRKKVDLFDRALSFDPADTAADSRLAYRPLFYLDEYTRLPRVHQDIDLLFYGTAHTDRYAVVKRLERALPQGTRFEKILYIPSELIYRTRRTFDPAFWRARRSEFVFTAAPKQTLLSLIARSKIVLDIERTIQTGYTMRTCEMIGAGRKLVTTNAEVAKAEFAHPSNVAIIDRHRPRISEAFLSSPFEPTTPEATERYSLRGWVDDVLPD